MKTIPRPPGQILSYQGNLAEIIAEWRSVAVSTGCSHKTSRGEALSGAPGPDSAHPGMARLVHHAERDRRRRSQRNAAEPAAKLLPHAAVLPGVFRAQWGPPGNRQVAEAA